MLDFMQNIAKMNNINKINKVFKSMTTALFYCARQPARLFYDTTEAVRNQEFYMRESRRPRTRAIKKTGRKKRIFKLFFLPVCPMFQSSKLILD
ncbi:MAG: hypothetical protein A2008_11605 [Candidatus Wallbacteria bacterium GWC2_49_35]|uniref:Uncharacterized protein n=1 Tax=Candidatus Wallbacteria bacterium GWC2_49_35 TaxID=1817813 RepID=A0A1F7WVH3_9BACT|nr:MAG: hypothetical protein A2008_11605 [Candidatus Wallbacteria bacterium GWC2_49_35]